MNEPRRLALRQELLENGELALIHVGARMLPLASLVTTPVRQRSPAASSEDLSSTRWREFICSKRTVARPVGVTPGSRTLETRSARSTGPTGD